MSEENNSDPLIYDQFGKPIKKSSFTTSSSHNEQKRKTDPDGKADEKSEQFVFGIPIGKSIGIIVSTSFVVFWNHVSGNPLVLYLWSFGFSAWLIWKLWPAQRSLQIFLLLTCVLMCIITHIYIQFEMESTNPFWSFLLKKEPPPKLEPPKPRLQLGFSIAGERGFPFMVTNDIYKLKYSADSLFNLHVLNTNLIADFKGVIVAPYPTGTSNVTVILDLSTSGSEIDNANIKIAIATPSVRYSLGSGWNADTIGYSDVGSLFFCEIPKIIPGMFAALPPITFDTHGPFTIAIVVLVYAPGLDAVASGIQLHLKELGFPVKPFQAVLDVTTNADGTGNARIDFGTNLLQPSFH